VRNGQGWTIGAGNNHSMESKEGPSFWLEPVMSWTTGESIATFSVLIPPDKAPLTAAQATPARAAPAEPASGVRSNPSWVFALDVDLPSLRNVVLPPGYGFAVIDEKGSVLFHSEVAHLREDFLLECDNNPRLQAAVYGKASEAFNGRYLGSDHRFYVTQLAKAGGPPWSLVVFRDKQLLRTLNVEALSVALILYGWLFLSLVPLFLIFWTRRTDWLWPGPKSGNYYPALL